MRRLKDRNHVAVSPKVWIASTGHKIPWNSSSEPFHSFVAKVGAYYERNGLSAPSLEEIEDAICNQLADFWCTNGAGDTTVRTAITGRSRGCSACGKRR